VLALARCLAGVPLRLPRGGARLARSFALIAFFLSAQSSVKLLLQASYDFRANSRRRPEAETSRAVEAR
jgi:hypothetical protein